MTRPVSFGGNMALTESPDNQTCELLLSVRFRLGPTDDPQASIHFLSALGNEILGFDINADASPDCLFIAIIGNESVVLPANVYRDGSEHRVDISSFPDGTGSFFVDGVLKGSFAGPFFAVGSITHVTFGITAGTSGDRVKIDSIVAQQIV